MVLPHPSLQALLSIRLKVSESANIRANGSLYGQEHDCGVKVAQMREAMTTTFQGAKCKSHLTAAFCMVSQSSRKLSTKNS